jgi:hypothetical protein
MWVSFIYSKILFIAFSERSDNWHSAKGGTHEGRPEQTFPHISFSGNRSHFQMPVLKVHIFSSLAHLWSNSWPSKAKIIFNRCCTSIFHFPFGRSCINMNSQISKKEPTRCNRVLEFIIPMFLNCSTCFGRHSAHHQELKNCNCSLWFYTRLRLSHRSDRQP